MKQLEQHETAWREKITSGKSNKVTILAFGMSEGLVRARITSSLWLGLVGASN